MDCYNNARGGAKQRRNQAISALWLEGLTLTEIAARLGSTKNSIGVTVTRLREQGWNLPYRRRADDRSRKENATPVKAGATRGSTEPGS